MPKDNENIPPLDDLHLPPNGLPGFSPDKMVRCDECLRSNPPTRVNCLYCGVALPASEAAAALAKPSLRPLEKWEFGYSSILLPWFDETVDDKLISAVASLLRLENDAANQILTAGTALPLARTATLAEAELIKRRLTALGLQTIIVSDDDLGLQASSRLRALDVAETDLVAHHVGGDEGIRISAGEIKLLVVARLFVKQVEMKERKSRRAESEILDTSETMSDEAVADIYTHQGNAALRIAANSFDFSCLDDQKGLLANDNFSTLIRLLRAKAPQTRYDDSYKSVRRELEQAWPLEQHTDSLGWHRDWKGRYGTGALTTTSNEAQFTRYSRLRRYLQLHGFDQAR